MNKLKFYKWLIAGLVLSNGLLILFLILGKPHHPQKPREVIIEALHFDQSQIKQYDELIAAHRKSINEHESKLVLAKNMLYQELRKPEDELTRGFILQKISHIQRDIEQAHFTHFLGIKAICKKEQMDDFNSLTKELGKLFQPPHPPKTRR